MFRLLLLAGLGAGALSASSAWATVTIVPKAPYALDAAKTVWYASDSVAHVDTDFQKLTLTDTWVNGFRSLVEFDVEVLGAAAGSVDKPLVITVYVDSPADPAVPIKIAAVSRSACTTNTTDATGGCQGLVADDYGYASVRVANGQTRRLGFYLEDVCKSAGRQFSQAYGCDTGDQDSKVTLPGTNGAATEFRFTVYVGLATSATAPGDTEGAESVAFKLKVQSGQPTFTCGVAEMSKFYFPGDGEIITEPSVFSSAVEAGAASSPVGDVVLVANRGNVPYVGPGVSGIAAGMPIERLAVGGGAQSVRGFQNTETGGDGNEYTISFAARDRAGALSTPFTCAQAGIRTSAIDGYLRANKCFIATAAYGVRDAPGLMLLRNFRDQVLLPTTLGTAFVEWYYAWSPDAAHWLINHPVLRGPVRAVLLPLQIIAWFCLNPLFFLLVLGCVGGLWMVKRRRTTEGDVA